MFILGIIIVGLLTFICLEIIGCINCFCVVGINICGDMYDSGIGIIRNLCSFLIIKYFVYLVVYVSICGFVEYCENLIDFELVILLWMSIIEIILLIFTFCYCCYLLY